MRCYYHPHKHAVAQCIDCHKGLCYHCAHKYQIPICEDCNRNRRSADMSHYLMPIVVCVILFAIGYGLNFMSSEPVMSGYVLMSIYGGWKALNQLLPIILVWINLSSIFWYLVFKALLAVLMGVFITPIYLIYCLYKLCQLLLMK